MPTIDQEYSSSKNSSPRLSFSNDIPPQKHDCSSSYSFSSSDFEFSVGLDIITSQEPVHADEIFSDGKILPLPLKIPKVAPIAKPAASPTKKPSWRFGRSNSLNFGGSRIMRMRFLRSKSTGSDPNPITNPAPKPVPKPPRKKGCKSFYYSGESRGGMSPVGPYFAKERNGMGVIGFLLCSCGDKRMEYYSSP